MDEIIQLFLVFAKMGAFTFGGGYAMLPIIQEEIVEKRGWASNEEIIDYYAIGQSTPGIIAVNTATFIGYKRKGIAGGISATLGVVFPSLIIISIIASIFRQFLEYAIVQHAFAGIQIVVVALIFNTVVKLYRQSVKDNLTAIIFLLAFILMIILKPSPVIVVLLAAFVGWFSYGNIKTKENN